MTDPYREMRIEKMRAMAALGFPAYPNDIRPGTSIHALTSAYGEKPLAELEALSQNFSVAGRAMAIRIFGKAGFVDLMDATGRLQVFVQKQGLSDAEFELFKKLDIGDWLYAEGPLFRTKTDEFSLRAAKISLVSKSLQTLPEKWHGLSDIEIRYRQRYVDLIVNRDVKETFVKRSAIISWLRRYLSERNFLEVETPMMQSIPGGAKAKPFVTHHHALDRDLYLRIAPELYLKRLLVGGFERVFELNRNFRNEGMSTQHNPEFTMLEFYQTYATYEDLIAMTEDMLSTLACEAMGSFELPYGEHRLSWKPPFSRYTLVEALQKVAGLTESESGDLAYLKGRLARIGIAPVLKDLDEADAIGTCQALLFEEEVEKKLIQPTFITHFPIAVSPLSRRNAQNPRYADRFELFIAGREIANAFSELNDPLDQAERFASQLKAREGGDDEAMAYDADFIRALEFGMPPAAGEGIGIDRLVMLLTNSPSIRDVILFPQLREASE